MKSRRNGMHGSHHRLLTTAVSYIFSTRSRSLVLNNFPCRFKFFKKKNQFLTPPNFAIFQNIVPGAHSGATSTCVFYSSVTPTRPATVAAVGWVSIRPDDFPYAAKEFLFEARKSLGSNTRDTSWSLGSILVG